MVVVASEAPVDVRWATAGGGVVRRGKSEGFSGCCRALERVRKKKKSASKRNVVNSTETVSQ